MLLLPGCQKALGQLWINVAPGTRFEQTLEIRRNFSFTRYPEIGFRVLRISAPLGLDGPLQDGNPRTFLRRTHRGRESGASTPNHYDIVGLLFNFPRDWHRDFLRPFP